MYIEDLGIDCGEVYSNLNNGTTAAEGLLDKAQAQIATITGTVVGYDLPVRSLADAYICQQVLGSSSGADQSVGIIRIGRPQIALMRENFIKDCKSELARDGFMLQKSAITIEVVNQ